MLGLPRACPPGTKGADSLAHLSGEQLAGLAGAEGVKWVGTYLEVLTPEYRDLLFSLGLGIAPLTEARTGIVDRARGDRAGQETLARCHALSMPSGCHVTIDLEDCEGDATGYVDGFAEALLRGGLRSMLYVGVPQPLNAAELQALAPDRYWRSGSLSAVEPMRRWSVLQCRPLDVLYQGTRIDWDFVEADAHGATPVLWWPS